MLFVGTSIIHPSTEGVFLLCNILDLLIYSLKNALKHPTVSLKNKTQQAFRYVNVPECIIISDSIDQTVLFQLLILHKTLKDVRNTMNHASSELNYKLDAIVLALKYYMIWLEQINPNQN